MQKYTRFDAQSFKDAMINNMNSIGKYMLEIILHQQRTPHLLKQKKLIQTQEDHSNPIQALNIDSFKVDLVVIQNTCSEKEDILSIEDLKRTRIEHGFKRAFMSLFGQDVDTFTSTMLLNVDQLQKKLDKDEFQKDGSIAAFWVVNNQFQKFIDSQFTLDYDSQMTDKYFVKYTGIEVKHFKDTLLKHMGNVKKSVAERTRHKRQYDRRVNKRQIQTQESKIDTGKAVDVDLVVTKSSETESVTPQFLHIATEANLGYYFKIFTGHRFSPNTTSAVYEKTSPRSNLRWKPTGRIFKSIGLRWIPTGKLFDSCTSKVDSEPPHGSNKEQSLDLSAGLDDGVAASFQRSRIHKPHAHTHAFKVNRSTSRSLILNFPTIKEPHNQIKNQHNLIKEIKSRRSSQEMMQDKDPRTQSQKIKAQDQDHKA
ncbi:hypothetical protein Tco_0674374 [Tanacetum coccineum]